MHFSSFSWVKFIVGCVVEGFLDTILCITSYGYLYLANHGLTDHEHLRLWISMTYSRISFYYCGILKFTCL